MSNEDDGSMERMSLLDEKSTSQDYGGTPVGEQGDRPSATAESPSYHSMHGSVNASSEQAGNYSASDEKNESTNQVVVSDDGNRVSCGVQRPSLLVTALVFFVITTVVLTVVIILIATKVVIIGTADTKTTVRGGSDSLPNKAAAAAPNSLPLLASVFDFEQHAQKVLDPNAWNYFSSGATEMITVRDNVAAYRRLRIRPNREVDVSSAATSLNISTFGGTVSIPIGFSPTAGHWWANKESEIGTACAAESINTVMIVSHSATTLTTDIAAAVPGALLWQQMYIFGDEKDTRYMIDLAEKSGCKALVLTIDKPAPTICYHALRGQIIHPADYPTADNHPPNLSINSFFYKKQDWAGITWLTNQTKLPVIVKGILTALEARQAVNHGASGILVSNHGGRALDSVPATIDQLAEIVAEVKGQVPVYVDGGIRTGIDVFKALAIGADMVFVGRPVLWGLAYDGQRGVEKVINILTDELVNTMQLAGTANLTAINPNYIYHPDPMAACPKV